MIHQADVLHRLVRVVTPSTAQQQQHSSSTAAAQQQHSSSTAAAQQQHSSSSSRACLGVTGSSGMWFVVAGCTPPGIHQMGGWRWRRGHHINQRHNRAQAVEALYSIHMSEAHSTPCPHWQQRPALPQRYMQQHISSCKTVHRPHDHCAGTGPAAPVGRHQQRYLLPPLHRPAAMVSEGCAAAAPPAQHPPPHFVWQKSPQTDSHAPPQTRRPHPTTPGVHHAARQRRGAEAVCDTLHGVAVQRRCVTRCMVWLCRGGV
jgi:hypothetical protein